MSVCPGPGPGPVRVRGLSGCLSVPALKIQFPVDWRPVVKEQSQGYNVLFYKFLLE